MASCQTRDNGAYLDIRPSKVALNLSWDESLWIWTIKKEHSDQLTWLFGHARRQFTWGSSYVLMMCITMLGVF